MRIVNGELIERSPVIVFDEVQTIVLMENKLDSYLWVWNCGEEIKITAIALGLISLCNHSKSPNCKIDKHYDSLMIDLIAIRDIEADEELTLQYLSTDFEEV